MSDAPGPGSPAPRRRARKGLGFLVKALVFALIVHLFVIPQIGGARQALHTVSAMSPPLLVLALGLEATAIAAYGGLTRVLLPAATRPGLAVCTGIVLSSMGVNHVVPGGAASTAAVNYRLFSLAGVDRSELAYVLVTQAVGSAVVLNLILWLALLVSIPVSGFYPVYAVVAGLGAAIMAVAALASVGLVRGQARLANAIARPLSRLLRRDVEQIEAPIRQAGGQLAAFLRDGRRLRLAVALAAANWLLDASALWVCLAAFGHRPSVVGVLVAYGVANVIAAIPITPGGLGIVEAVLIPSLIGFGSPASVVAIGVIAYRLASFWLPIPTGIVSYFLIERHLSDKPPQGPRPVVADLWADDAAP